MSIAKKMWDYLKSIGFVDIPNDDERLGCQTRGNWKYIISRDNLCAYCSRMDKFIGFVDNLKGNDGTNTDLNIHTVQDLENWLRKEYPEFYKDETNMITKDNIEAVLKHNGIKPISQCAPNENKKGYIKSESRLHLYGLDICLDNPNLISIIEAHIGKKLEPLPEEEIVLKVGDEVEFSFGVLILKSFDYIKEKVKYHDDVRKTRFEDINDDIESVNGKKGKYVIPSFDFKQTLLESGVFTPGSNENYIKSSILEIVLDECMNRFNFWGIRDCYYECTPSNAKILIEAAAIPNVWNWQNERINCIYSVRYVYCNYF